MFLTSVAPFAVHVHVVYTVVGTGQYMYIYKLQYMYFTSVIHEKYMYCT